MSKFLFNLAAPIVLICIAMIITLKLYLLIDGTPLDLGFVKLVPSIGIDQYSTLQLGIALIPSAIFLYALFRLFLLMRLFSKEEYFSVSAISHLRGFAAAYMLSTLLAILLVSCLPLLPQKNIESSQVSELFMSFVFFIIAYVLDQARQNKEALEGFF